MTNLTLSNRDSSNGFVINNFDELDKPSVSLSATEDINGDRISNLTIEVSEAEQPIVTKGIVFIDPNIDDYQTLKAGVKPGLDVVLLDGSQEGIAQITQALKGRRGLSSLHIVAHGEAGGLWLGSGLVNSNSLDQYRQDLQSWAAALAPGADILLYGCNVAAGETGEQFVGKLSQLTGADVAASSNLTGSAALGGDWELEVKIGEIEAPLAFQVEAMEGYSAVLDIKRVSVATDGTQGNNFSSLSSISADGRYVAFSSYASNLVSGDTNGSGGIFVRDLLTNTTSSVSLATDGTQGNNSSDSPSISADGRYVAFYSGASNLVSGDTNNSTDIFVRDLLTNTTRRVSLASDGTQGNDNSGSPSISADGRYVAFTSSASNLVSGDTNGKDDIFVRDLLTNTTRRVSVATDGTQGNNYSNGSSISADGRYVAFESYASNLVSGDTNDTVDVFVRDLLTNTTRRVSLATDGTQGNSFSYWPSISADGRYVAFDSYAGNLVSGDTNPSSEIFVRDLLTNTTRRVSLLADDIQGNSLSYYPSISADGRYVAFSSYASNLVSGDTNGSRDIFVRDLLTNTTRRVSLATDGTQGNIDSYGPSISADGRYVAFSSGASNLVSGDTNSRTDIFVATTPTTTVPPTPVAWWKLDATSGNIAVDSAGHNDGILQNNPTPTTGKVDDGLTFDGVNDYVQIADNDALDFGTGDFSISTWVKTTDDQKIDVFLDKRVEDSGPVQGYVLYNYYGKLGLQLSDGIGSGWTNYTSNTSINDGQWHHVSVSVDRDNPNGGQWYIDGNPGETFNPTGRQGSLSNSKPLILGNRSDSSWEGYLNGSLDEVKLFNTALSSADAQAIYLNDINPFVTKPVAWWKFDATSGNIAADSAGHNDGILQNNPTPTIGKVDDGLSFDGVNDYVQVADNPALNFGPSLNFGTGDFSINTWVKTTDNQGTDVILDKHVEDSGSTQGYVLYNYDGKLAFQLADGSGSTNYISNVSITDGKWHQVSVTIDRDNPNGGQWYVDGDQVETFNPTGRQGSLSNSKPLTIGNRSDSSWEGYFNGSLDEVQLFNKSLSATEVKAIYQTTPTGNETLEIPQGALVGTEDSDTLFASVEHHTIYGLGGNDTIYANEGNNTIYGGAGNDTIYAGNGNDLIDGGAGDDTIYANEGNNTIYGGTGDDLIYAGSGSDTIIGGDGNDIIYSGAGDNLINGGLGDDTIWLGGGHDTVTLESGVGFDTINSFQLGQTTFTLGSGLKTSDLTINDGTRGSEIYAGSDLLAVVSWTQASTINNNLSAVFV